MASLSTDANGRRRLQVVDRDGKRHSIRLGRVAKRHAETVRAHVEELVGSQRTGNEPAQATRQWLSELDPQLLRALSRIGLVQKGDALQLDELVTAYLERRRDLKPKTRGFLRHSTDCLIEHFGPDRQTRSITVAEAKDWRRWMLSKGLSEATARTYARGVKQVFADARERGLIENNPFQKLPTGSVANTNNRYVTRDEGMTLLDACIEPEWRVLIALCRFAGLRCPSETHGLRWRDIDLENKRLTVRSPKTEHHVGHESREVPMQPVVAEAISRLPVQSHGAAVMLTISRHNLHRRLATIVKRAGIEPWRDPFHCLRRSCQTEWAQHFPEYAVAKWIGNSTVVARRHYLKVPPELAARATELGTAGLGVVQNAAQYLHEPGRSDSQRERDPNEPDAVSAAECETSHRSANTPRRTRTYNPLIKSQLLYRLS